MYNEKMYKLMLTKMQNVMATKLTDLAVFITMLVL